jgi:signal transduction histidine kinase
MVVAVWLPIFAISILHYSISPHHPWAHDVLRRLYYLPIVVAALQLGLRGGIAAALVISVSYIPHAFIHPVMFDPGRGMEKVLEIILYFVVGTISGHLAGAEQRRRAELHEALVDLRRSLTEQQRLTQQLVRAGRLSALGEVVAGIAHEIKNPLHSLAGTAEIVDPLIPLDAEERRLWELHVSELERLQRVAERFLSFARPQMADSGPVDLGDVVRRLEQLVGAQVRQQAVELTTSLPDEPIIVDGDRDQLAQVAMNIVLNALTAIGNEGGEIHVAAELASRRNRGMHGIHITNNGPTIPEEMVEHIFDPFVSGDDRGSGLGLSISYRIVEHHGGYIEVENCGLGVTFSVYLPAARTRSDRGHRHEQ